MFSTEESWKMREPEKVLAILKEVGVWRLAHWDGCTCTHFNVRHVDVDVSCGKGRDRGLWISSKSLDYWDGKSNGCDENLLRPIAEEVARQIQESDGRGPIPIPIHFREWDNTLDR